MNTSQRGATETKARVSTFLGAAKLGCRAPGGKRALHRFLRKVDMSRDLSCSWRLGAAVLAMILILSPRFVHAQTPTLDDFSLRAYGDVYSLAVQADGKVLVGGLFNAVAEQTREYICRTYPNGTLDTDFDPEIPGEVQCFAVQADGKILLSGYFRKLCGQPREYIGRLNPDGTLDTGFNPGASYYVNALVVQPDGKILAGGLFTTLGGEKRNYIGRLNPDGTLDPGFNPKADYWVYSLAVQADGKILLGGEFTMVGEQKRKGIARLNPDGTLDTGFDPGAVGSVGPLAVQPDGKILVGGYFTTLGGQPRSYFGRLNPDGTLDTAFDPGANGPVNSLAVQADGKILVGGYFTTLGGQARNRIARLNSDGTLDSGFNPVVDVSVLSLAVQEDGKVLVGTRVSAPGNTLGSIARLNATDPATQGLSYNGSTITWLRGGTSPEAWGTTFDASTNGVEWVSLGMGTRITGGWQSTEVSIPTNSIVRARGHITGGAYNGSSWFVESVLTIGNPRVPPVLSVESVTGESMWFKLTGGTNAQYAVQTATNLPSADEWQPVTTLTLTNGWGRFGWTNTGDALRFFRAK